MVLNASLRSVLRAATCLSVRSSFLALTGLLLCDLSYVQAEDVDIIRVEEDWELDVAAPDPAANCPQVVCVFGPADPETDTHAVFEINHGTAPDFQSGGMQIQCWWRDTRLGFGNHPNNREFDASVDHITFTTVTELKNDRLYLEITDGDSVNWGHFGDEGYLRMVLYSNRPNLNNYNANHSVRHSRIVYGKHRVNMFVRNEVRFYTSDGLHQTVDEDAVIFTQTIDTGEE